MARFEKTVASTLVAAILFACGGGTSSDATPNRVTVAVEPPSTRVDVNGTAHLAATVTGTADLSVLWDVVESAGGAVDSSGLYTAPQSAGVFHVRATSRAAPDVSGHSTVTVVLPVAVSVSPHAPSVVAGGTMTFTATVTNNVDARVVWSVPVAGCGTITQLGVYTAPLAAATCSVVATSQADPSKSDTATVTVTAPPPPIVVTITPSPAAVDSCRSISFSATVTGTSNTGVTWSVQEGVAGGTIGPDGSYTAPENAGTYHVVATSTADVSKLAVTAVVVTDHILSVAVSPQTVQVPAGGTAQLTATVMTTCGTVTQTKIINSLGRLVEK